MLTAQIEALAIAAYESYARAAYNYSKEHLTSWHSAERKTRDWWREQARKLVAEHHDGGDEYTYG